MFIKSIKRLRTSLQKSKKHAVSASFFLKVTNTPMKTEDFHVCLYPGVVQDLCAHKSSLVCTQEIPCVHTRVPSTWYQVLGTKYLVPSTWYQVLGTKCLVPSTWYQVLGTKKNVFFHYKKTLFLCKKKKPHNARQKPRGDFHFRFGGVNPPLNGGG